VRAREMGGSLTTPLEDVATGADEVADAQRRVARRARAMQRLRDRGRSWAEILDRDAAPGLLRLLRSSGRRLAETTGRFAQSLARGLAAEGESQRRIARRLGVTHQRVSAMLRLDGRLGSGQGAGADR
jgi:hypothetical protein